MIEVSCYCQDNFQTTAGFIIVFIKLNNNIEISINRSYIITITFNELKKYNDLYKCYKLSLILTENLSSFTWGDELYGDYYGWCISAKKVINKTHITTGYIRQLYALDFNPNNIKELKLDNYIDDVSYFMDLFYKYVISNYLYNDPYIIIDIIIKEELYDIEYEILQEEQFIYNENLKINASILLMIGNDNIKLPTDIIKLISYKI